MFPISYAHYCDGGLDLSEVTVDNKYSLSYVLGVQSTEHFSPREINFYLFLRSCWNIRFLKAFGKALHGFITEFLSNDWDVAVSTKN